MPFGKPEQAAGLLDISNNKPVPADYMDWFFQEGYVEVVHVTSKEPVARDSPHAVIRVTPAGWAFMRRR
jgi:hypothetical protein